MASKPATTVGARSGPPSVDTAVQMWRTVGRIQGGNTDSLCFAALCGFNLEGVPAFPDVRNCAREVSLVGVTLAGVARDAGELSAFDADALRPLALGRPAKEVAGSSLSRSV